MLDLYIKTIYTVLYIIAAIGRAPYAIKVKKIKPIISLKKTRETVLIILGLPMMILPLIYVFTDWIDPYNLILPLELRIIGGIGFLSAVLLHNWSHFALDINWSEKLDIKKNQKLITTGPYKYVRHPMYSAFLLWSISQGIFLSNWFILVAGTACFLLIYIIRVDDEEKMMLKQFGNEYKEFMKTRGRIFPKF